MDSMKRPGDGQEPNLDTKKVLKSGEDKCTVGAFRAEASQILSADLAPQVTELSKERVDTADFSDSLSQQEDSSEPDAELTPDEVVSTRHQGTPGRGAKRKSLIVLPVVELDAVPRAVLGCIQIPTDVTLDSEGPMLVKCLPGVVMLMQKIVFDSDLIQADTYLRAVGNVGRAAATFLPARQISVMGLSCTSMSFVLGPDVVDQQLCQGNPHVKTTDMARAQIAAVKAIGAKKVALLTPYVEELSVANMRMLERAGIEVVERGTMGLTNDELTARVTSECISGWVDALNSDEADAVIIGCSAFRACSPGFIDALEKRIQKPVITSTQAFMWSMVRAAGVEDQIPGYGILFRNH